MELRLMRQMLPRPGTALYMSWILSSHYQSRPLLKSFIYNQIVSALSPPFLMKLTSHSTSVRMTYLVQFLLQQMMLLTGFHKEHWSASVKMRTTDICDSLFCCTFHTILNTALHYHRGEIFGPSVAGIICLLQLKMTASV